MHWKFNKCLHQFNTNFKYEMLGSENSYMRNMSLQKHGRNAKILPIYTCKVKTQFEFLCLLTYVNAKLPALKYSIILFHFLKLFHL